MNRLSRPFLMEAIALTPVHIGVSLEERWHRDWDFVPAPDGSPYLHRLDLDRLLALLPEDALLRGGDEPPVRWVEPRQWARARLSTHRLHGPQVPGEVLPLLRDARGAPFLPGSTLKGALRTALLRALLGDTSIRPQDLQGEEGRPPRPPFAGQAVEERFLRPVPQGRRRSGTTGANYDLMRVPRLGDAYPETGETEVVPVVWAGAGQVEGRLLTWVEVFPPGTRFRFVLRLDRVLAEQEGPRPPHLNTRPLQSGLAWPPSASRVGDLAYLAGACRSWSLEVLDRQKRLASALGDPLRTEVLTALEGLEGHARGLKGEAFLLAVGWGTGWYAKTMGERITDPALKRVGARRPGGLRLAVREGRSLVLGWMEVHPRQMQGRAG